jgi:hypothetical protein
LLKEVEERRTAGAVVELKILVESVKAGEGEDGRGIRVFTIQTPPTPPTGK